MTTCMMIKPNYESVPLTSLYTSKIVSTIQSSAEVSSDDSLEDVTDGPSPSKKSRSSELVVECKVFNTINTSNTLKFEGERLATFTGWPLSWLSPAVLAKEGLYYLHEEDKCSCIFCHIIIGMWEMGDVVRTEHAKLSPRCPFIMNLPVGNIPMLEGDILASLHLELATAIEQGNNDMLTFIL